jgi:hypothetical protein
MTTSIGGVYCREVESQKLKVERKARVGRVGNNKCTIGAGIKASAGETRASGSFKTEHENRFLIGCGGKSGG